MWGWEWGCEVGLSGGGGGGGGGGGERMSGDDGLGMMDWGCEVG